MDESDILDFFIDNMNFESIEKIDDSHIAVADQAAELVNDTKCSKLAEFHAIAVEFAKSGYSPPVDTRYLAK